jgi:UDP-N-acetylmuramoyl-L-alanyl-D-glutamate--2,6-diaminopimelate ligase
VGFRLSDLLEGTEAAVDPVLAVTGVNADSRAIGRGDAFFALPGTKVHGVAFAADAAKRGAIVMVTDRTVQAGPELLPTIVVPDVRAAYARAAARQFAPQPEIAVAVTGTNGKTSVTSFVRQIWASCGIKAAGLGTLGIETSEGIIEGTHTTPDPLSLHRSLGALKSRGIDHVAMEASSHGLDQRRLDGLRFAAVAFTNLTRDHLDYHASLEAYRDAKLRLFTDLLAEGGAAVVNADDPGHAPFARAALDRGATLLTVGRHGEWLRIDDVLNEGFGQRIIGRLNDHPIDLYVPLTGAFQASNAVVAFGLATATGAPEFESLAALGRLKGAKGRLELVGQRDGAAVFVDYAHTPDALRNALQALRPYATGRLVVVFGAGGDRDKGKRPQMGAIATELADMAIVTDDNPRTENASAIRAEILAGAPGAREIGDRHAAIETAIGELGPSDVLLIAGKGHEDYQIVGTTKHHFSDHEVVAEALARL